ncbi:MAG: T9SS type A sorting domain-containing protein [Bacteroidota bacterium]
MKKVILLSVIFLALNTLMAQNVFNKKYNPDVTESRAEAVVAASDGGYLVAGFTHFGGVLGAFKTNYLGDTLWSFILELGINVGNYLFTAIEVTDGNYIVGGVSGDPILHRSHATLIKLNKNTGDTIWVRKIGLPNRSERNYNVKQTPDNGFVFCGLRFNEDSLGNTTDDDVYLVKTDSMGIPQWKKTYGGSNYDYAQSVELTAEGGYMILGTTYSYGVGQYNMYLIKTDSLGNMLWQKTYGGSLEDYGQSIVKMNDGNYALAGGTYVSTDTLAGYILKIDTAGIVIWQKKYRGIIKQQEFSGVKQLPTGELVVCGSMQGDTLNNSFYGIVKKLNENDGSAVWQNQYQYYNTDSTQHYFYGIDLCLDGGLVMAGMSTNFHHGVNPANSMWLVKTDCMGNDSIWDSVSCSLPIGVSEVVAKDINDVLVYPNPATNQITIENSQLRINAIRIYNVLGSVVYQQLTTNNQQLSIDASTWNAGVYFVEVETEKGTVRKKIIKE